MTEKRTIARPYARSAFEFASSSGTLDAWKAALEALAAIVSEPAAKTLIHHPRVTDPQLVETLLEAGGTLFTGPIENFIRTLVEAGRVELAPEILAVFTEQQAQASGIADICVSTAFALEDAQRSSLEETMKRHLGRSVTMRVEVDPGLIGGAVVSVGDKVIDLSVRGRLHGLSNQLN